MKYICDACSYETDIKYAYEKHLTSKKHLDKIDSDDVKNKYCCPYCPNEYSNAGNLSKHKKSCSEKKQLVDSYEKEIKEIQSLLKCKEESIIILKLEVDDLKLMINNTGSMVKSSMSTLSYIAKYYTKAPAIQPIKNMKILHVDCTNNKFVEQLMYEKKHKTLVNFIGDLIVGIYKKEDAGDQSIWASDISRLTYILRDMMGGKVDWVVDKKGIKATKYIIQPILNYINKCALKYINDTDPRHTGLTTEQAVTKAIQLNKAMEISNMIDDKMLIEELLKYIAPHFCVSKEEHLLE